jgi:hypothetical protein
MTGRSATRFGTNRGTHWTIAGSVAVIILGSYLVYTSHDSSPTTTMGKAAGTPAPTSPGPSTLKK